MAISKTQIKIWNYHNKIGKSNRANYFAVVCGLEKDWNRLLVFVASCSFVLCVHSSESYIESVGFLWARDYGSVYLWSSPNQINVTSNLRLMKNQHSVFSYNKRRFSTTLRSAHTHTHTHYI